MSENAVHVTIPLKDAYNLGGIESRLWEALKDTSCPQCCTGFDIHLEVERDFLVNPAFKMAGATLASRAVDRPTAALVFGGVSDFHRENVLSALKSLAEVNGHSPCASGLDISLVNFKDSMKLNAGAL